MLAAVDQPSPPALMLSEVTAAAISISEPAQDVDRRVRAKLKAFEWDFERDQSAFLREIRTLIEKKQQGSLELDAQDVSRMIDHAMEGEHEFRGLVRSNSKAFRRLADMAAQVSPRNRGVLLHAGRECERLLERYIAALQEGRWLLLTLRADLEGGNGDIVDSEQDLVSRLQHS
jgi:hypothetical protein